MALMEFRPLGDIANLEKRGKRSKCRDRRCAICGAHATCRHFAAYACNSCAAFFRRTVSSQQRYTCNRDKTCLITAESKTFCKACRLKRCVKSGMNFNAVCSAKRISVLTNLNTDSILWKFVMLQRSTYLNRYQSIINSYGGDQKLALIATENPTCVQSSVAIASEISVLLNYMRSSSFYQFGLSDDEFTELSKALFFPWISFQIIMHTLRNNGFKQNVIYCIDESYLTVHPDIVLKFVKTSKDLRDPDIVSRFTLEYFESTLKVASNFHAGKFEDFEFAAIFHIYAMQLAVRLYPENQNLKHHLNDLFKELRKQYDESFDDCAIRIGNVVMMLDQLNEVVSVYKHYVLMLELNGYKSVFAQEYGTSVQLVNGIKPF